MGSSELRNRSNWQTISGNLALKTEEKFQLILQNALNSIYPDQFIVKRHPNDFNNIY